MADGKLRLRYGVVFGVDDSLSAASMRKIVHLARETTDELFHLIRLAGTWPERLGMARLIVKLYLARLAPFDRYSWQVSVRMHGNRYLIGLRSSEVYVFEEIYGYRLYDRLDEFVPREGWTVVDAGANIGVFTILQARRGATVYAFEPNPACYNRLSRNIAANGFAGRATAFALALGERSGTGELRVEKGGTTGGTITPVDRDAASAERSVPIVRLDSIVPSLGIGQIDLLKIDVEGAEMSVLRGAPDTLQNVERIIIEYHSKLLLEQLRPVLVSAGFSEKAIIDYFPEAALEHEEVGVLYARRGR